MIDMDNFSLDLLPSASFCSRKNLPGIPAIYFAISRTSEVLYVGRSRWLRNRLQSHNLICELDYLGCNKIAWIEFEDTWGTTGCLLVTERFFIKKYEPLLNRKQGKPYPKKSPQLEAA